MKISNDIARCNGVGSDEEGWRDGCEDCLRRTSPRPDPCWMMEPPAIIVFECESRIERKSWISVEPPASP